MSLVISHSFSDHRAARTSTVVVGVSPKTFLQLLHDPVTALLIFALAVVVVNIYGEVVAVVIQIKRKRPVSENV
jgi:hypothetical protein